MARSLARAFYHSASWLNKRAEILERDNYECQRCKRKGRYHKAECVHHKQHLDKRPDLALTDSNLTSLCYSCHDSEHPEKLKKNNPKPFISEEKW
jgi:5-methylcytosine-specific restriction protein A